MKKQQQDVATFMVNASFDNTKKMSHGAKNRGKTVYHHDPKD
jgi:hypothetical protein